MGNDKPLNNNNRKPMNGSTKLVMSIAAILVAGFIAWVVQTTWQVDRGFEAFKATYKATYARDQVAYENNLESMATDRDTMKKEVAKNTDAWYVWEKVDKVRERDTKQDVRIETLQKEVADLQPRLREAEKLLAQWIMRTAMLEELIRR